MRGQVRYYRERALENQKNKGMQDEFLDAAAYWHIKYSKEFSEEASRGKHPCILLTADSESYFIGSLAGLLLRSTQVKSQETSVEKGANPLDCYLRVIKRKKLVILVPKSQLKIVDDTFSVNYSGQNDWAKGYSG
ncbi:MAG: hypothetical protein A2Z20_07620 [Bdellovibrionales bacterium RBG_16_40_8]|nr:MAG: hypothetical protein A2Z20_07620 [Bdellovibrionales bacterium RBG_16_40_8]